MASPTCIDALAKAQRQNRGERKGGTPGSAKVAMEVSAKVTLRVSAKVAPWGSAKD